jgi:hypothetical protein
VLLETWLLRAQLEVIGEQRGGFLGGPFYQWATFFDSMSEHGMDIAGNAERERMLKYHPGYYNVSLLHMFGLITLQDDAPEPGKGWRILHITKTRLGEAMLQVLYDKHMMTHDLLLFDEHDIMATIGKFQLKLQPFFPEWEHNLTLSEPEIQTGTYVFKVSLGSPWRRIAIPGDMTWDTLSGVILDAFGFDYDHLYQFIYKDRFGIERYLNHPYMEEYQFADEVAIQDVPLRPGANLIFFYDFGDSWRFRVQLEHIGPVDSKLKRPKIVEKHGKAPEQYRWE